jgi:nitrogen fixation NifU-like protein
MRFEAAAMNEGLDFYREFILDHARNRRNWGLLDPADFDHAEVNSMCGDELRLTLRLDDTQVIREVGWDGHGCAISQASASLLGEKLIGMKLADAVRMGRDDILDMVGLPLSPNRMRCALLSLKTLVVGASGARDWERIEDEE